MKVLGIETSCDETAAAVVQDGREILSNVLVSQIDIHAAFGGVVPEVAARSHIEVILPIIERAVQPVGWDKIDAIAVSNTPGLVGSLLIGVLSAKTLARLKDLPLYPVNHVVAHVYANFVSPKNSAKPSPTPKLPLLALVVSGGHTQLMVFSSHSDFEIVGQTRDDAVGEAFDKVAKILGLPYPGGPSIAQAAKHGQPIYALPHPKMAAPLDFSFSGLKTAVLRSVQSAVGVDHTYPSGQLAARLTAAQRADFAASFQQTAVEILIEKLKLAAEQFKVKSICLAGGVAANQLLRQAAKAAFAEVFLPPAGLSTDNAVMIAARGYYQSLQSKPISPDLIEVKPT
jgi:N6-L-threonylcarbamoyladenine synthase